MMIDAIHNSWGWLGVKPIEIMMVNEFGNVIFRDTQDTYWRICPEELSCDKIAETSVEYKILIEDSKFKADWLMVSLVQMAENVHGPQADDRCFCLKTPAVLGGGYDIDNVGTISKVELVSFAGNIAFQLKDVPDGTKVEFKFVD